MQLLLPMCALLATCMAGTPLVLDQAAKDKFIELHNKFRKDTGADMPALVWDDTLAKAADDICGKCQFAHPPENPYGENIYITSRNVDGATAAQLSSDKWHTEISRVAGDSWDCIGAGHSKTCGHYSQEIWAKTTKLGCSVTQGCQIWGNSWTMVFCEYDPAGNQMKAYDFDDQKWIPYNPY